MFSDAWWIGTEDENPEESELDFPEELERVSILITSFALLPAYVYNNII